MSAAFIGCKISLISKSEIRYEGILYTIDTKESTIALAKVRSFGTEDRQTDKPVAPRSEVYEYIIFRASDIKDLIVDDPPASGPGLSDPAIIQAQSGGASVPSTTFSAAPGLPPSVIVTSGVGGSQTTLANVLSGNQAGQALTTISGKAGFSVSRSSTPTNQRKSPVHQQRQERSNNAGGQHREQRDSQRGPQQFTRGGGQRRDGYQQRDGYQHQTQPRGPMQPGGQHYAPQGQRQPMTHQGFNRGGRGGQHGYVPNFANRAPNTGRPPGQNRPPNPWHNGRPGGQFNRPARPTGPDVAKLGDYDFEAANQELLELESKFEKLETDDSKPEEEEDEEPKNSGDVDDDEQHYDKKKSFFDSISCEAIERSKGNVQRIDRRQERKMNEETFGVGGIRHNNYRGRGGYRGGYGNRGGGYGQNRNFQRGGYNRRGQGDRQYSNGQSDGRPAPAQAQS
jgi:protein LSM14